MTGEVLMLVYSASFHSTKLYLFLFFFKQPALRHLAVSTLRHLIEKDPVCPRVTFHRQIEKSDHNKSDRSLILYYTGFHCC